jgi:hypothetical protein
MAAPARARPISFAPGTDTEFAYLTLRGFGPAGKLSQRILNRP